MIELNTGLYTKLNISAITNLLAGTTAQFPSSIYNQQAGEGAPYPYLVFSLQGGGDVNDTPNRLKNLLVFVRGYSKVSAAQAGSIDAQVDAALHLVPLTVSGWTNIWLARETDLETVELDPTGKRIFMQGGLYRAVLDKD